MNVKTFQSTPSKYDKHTRPTIQNVLARGHLRNRSHRWGAKPTSERYLKYSFYLLSNITIGNDRSPRFGLDDTDVIRETR